MDSQTTSQSPVRADKLCSEDRKTFPFAQPSSADSFLQFEPTQECSREEYVSARRMEYNHWCQQHHRILGAELYKQTPVFYPIMPGEWNPITPTSVALKSAPGIALINRSMYGSQPEHNCWLPGVDRVSMIEMPGPYDMRATGSSKFAPDEY